MPQKFKRRVGTRAGRCGAFVLFGSDPKDAEHFKSIRAEAWRTAESASDHLAQIIQRAAHRQRQDNVEHLAVGQGNDAMGRAYDILKTDESAEQLELKDRLQKLVSAQQERTNFIAFVLSECVSLSLAALLEQARAIASGDLSGKELEGKTGDEIGGLMSAMNEVQLRLREMIVAVAQMSGHVASSSENLRGLATR